MDDVVGGLIGSVGLVVVIVVAAYVWEFMRNAWYWTAAKVMGWDEHEKFMRETQWAEREEQRAIRQREKDAVVANDRNLRRTGCHFTVVGLVLLLASLPLKLEWSLWVLYQGTLAVLIYWSLHMVAGVTINWRG